jgi:hypothetical protein
MLRRHCLSVLIALPGLGSLPLFGESNFAVSYAETLAQQVTEAIEKKDEARFDLASNKLIALLYAKKSNEVHKRVGELLVQFDIQWALPVMVECMDQTESTWTRLMPKEFPLTTAVVAFGRPAVPALLEEMSGGKVNAYRASMLGAVLVGIVGTEEAAKLVSERRSVVAGKAEVEGLALVHQWIVEAGTTSIFLRIDRSKLPVPKKHLWSPDPE